MSKLNHTTEAFDSAIRKVRSDYADVTEVDATASDIALGKTVMTADKELITGTITNAEISPIVDINGDVLGDTVSSFPIKATPKVELVTSGFIDSIADGTTQTRYVKTEEKSVTPKSYEQTVTPSSSHLLSKVTIGAAEIPPVIENMRVGRVCFTRPSLSTTSASNCPYCATGGTHNNVYLNSSTYLSTAKVYLYYLGTSLSATTYFNVVDPTTKQVPSTTIVLSPGDSVTCTAHSYGPGGILTFTTEGRITFQHTSYFYSVTSSTMIVLLINGVYYTPCVDYKMFSHSYTGVGGFSSNSSRVSGGGFSIVTGTTGTTYYKPVTLFANLTPIYFYAYYSSSSSKEPLRMTFNYGTYYGFFVEKEDEE